MTASDRLLAGFALALGVLAAIFVPAPQRVIAGCGAITVAILAAARLRGRLRLLHDFLPVAVLAVLVNLCGPVIAHVNPWRWDAELAAADARLFGRLAPAWMHLAGRPGWLTDAASLAYASYYVLPIAVAGVIWLRKRDQFDRFVFAMTTVLLLSYTAYFAAPAAGPRVPEALAPALLGGGAISAALRAFLAVAERNQLDAFPSGHTAASLVMLAQSWPHLPRMRIPLAAAVAAIVFSTVYLSLHYVVDVAAGAALAGVLLAALPALRVWSGVDRPRPLLRWSFRQ